MFNYSRKANYCCGIVRDKIFTLDFKNKCFERSEKREIPEIKHAIKPPNFNKKINAILS